MYVYLVVVNGKYGGITYHNEILAAYDNEEAAWRHYWELPCPEIARIIQLPVSSSPGRN